MELKKFVKDHKKEIVIGGVVVATVVGSVVLWKTLKVKNPKIVTESISKILKNPDLPKPSWEGMEVFEHWTENGVQNMIINCHACQLGELGDHLINDILTQANPDIPVEMVLSYGSSCHV